MRLVFNIVRNFLGLVLNIAWNVLGDLNFLGLLFYMTWARCIINPKTFLALKLFDFIFFFVDFFVFWNREKDCKKITKWSKSSTVNIDSSLRNAAKTGLLTKFSLEKVISYLKYGLFFFFFKSYLKQLRFNYEQYILFYTKLNFNNKIYIYITKLLLIANNSLLWIFFVSFFVILSICKPIIFNIINRLFLSYCKCSVFIEI